MAMSPLPLLQQLMGRAIDPRVLALLGLGGAGAAAMYGGQVTGGPQFGGTGASRTAQVQPFDLSLFNPNAGSNIPVLGGAKGMIPGLGGVASAMVGGLAGNAGRGIGNLASMAGTGVSNAVGGVPGVGPALQGAADAAGPVVNPVDDIAAAASGAGGNMAYNMGGMPQGTAGTGRSGFNDPGNIDDIVRRRLAQQGVDPAFWLNSRMGQTFQRNKGQIQAQAIGQSLGQGNFDNFGNNVQGLLDRVLSGQGAYFSSPSQGNQAWENLLGAAKSATPGTSGQMNQTTGTLRGLLANPQWYNAMAGSLMGAGLGENTQSAVQNWMGGLQNQADLLELEDIPAQRGMLAGRDYLSWLDMLQVMSRGGGIPSLRGR